MAFKKDGTISFEINPDGINELIDERSNSTIMLREVAWNGRQSHLELRKWIIDEKGDKPMKGVSFLTEDGPHNLVDTMSKLGFGHTGNILKNIKDREDFDEELVKLLGKKKIEEVKNEEVNISEDDYFDPENIIVDD